MSSVYIVQTGEYSGRGIHGVYGTVDDAMTAVAHCGIDSYYGDWEGDIEEWEIGGDWETRRLVPMDDDHPSVTDAQRRALADHRAEQKRKVEEREVAMRRRQAEWEAQSRYSVLEIRGYVSSTGEVLNESEGDNLSLVANLESIVRRVDTGRGDHQWVIDVVGADREQVRKVYGEKKAEIMADLQGLT